MKLCIACCFGGPKKKTSLFAKVLTQSHSSVRSIWTVIPWNDDWLSPQRFVETPGHTSTYPSWLVMHISGRNERKGSIRHLYGGFHAREKARISNQANSLASFLHIEDPQQQTTKNHNQPQQKTHTHPTKNKKKTKNTTQTTPPKPHTHKHVMG